MHAPRLMPLALATLAIAGCVTHQRSAIDHASIASEIRQLADDDQHYDQLVINADPQIQTPGFYDRKRQLQIERTARITQIFADIGFPAPPEFDTETASDFWLLVQHSDNDPLFQQQVLDAMHALSEGTVRPSEKAYLIDRVRINTNREQIYGTQVDYDFDQARAYPKPLADPASVDQRRRDVSLEPLSQYMNTMSEMNHTMNRAMYLQRGIETPWVYPPDFRDWDPRPAADSAPSEE
ncbi:MAG: DUF6624 domain-containing protein [Planctomycetota bacterium]